MTILILTWRSIGYENTATKNWLKVDIICLNSYDQNTLRALQIDSGHVVLKSSVSDSLRSLSHLPITSPLTNSSLIFPCSWPYEMASSYSLPTTPSQTFMGEPYLPLPPTPDVSWSPSVSHTSTHWNVCRNFPHLPQLLTMDLPGVPPMSNIAPTLFYQSMKGAP